MLLTRLADSDTLHDMKKLLIVLTAVLIVSFTRASSVTLAWDAEPQPVCCYNLYYGVSSRVYTNSVSVVGTNYATIANVYAGGTYFAVTAVYTNGLESSYSSEIFRRTNPVPGIPAPPVLKSLKRTQ